MLSRWLNWWISCEFIFPEIGLELLSCLGYILVHKGIANKLLFVHNKRGRVMEVRSMTSSHGLPLPLSQGWPTAAIWFIWKFYPCFPSPSSLIQTTWVRSLICMSQLKSASNQYTYIVDPAEHCQLLHRLPHHLPLRGGHLCSRLWDSVHQGGEDPGGLPIVNYHLLIIPLARSSVFWWWWSALLLRTRSSPISLLLWQCETRAGWGIQLPMIACPRRYCCEEVVIVSVVLHCVVL